MKTVLLIAIILMPLTAILFDTTFIAAMAITLALTGGFLFLIRKELKIHFKEEP